MASVWTIKAEGEASTLDEAQARRALALLIAPGERHEIRSLPGGRSRQASGDDLDAAIKDAKSLDGTLYYSLNPIEAGVERAKRETVTRRAWMLVDVDPVRPPDVCATDDEKAKAAEVVAKALDDLESRGWPAPLVVDSGNGWHLLYKIDLPHDNLAKAAIQKFLNGLADAHDTGDAKIDRKVHDAARVSKLPGSWSRKGLDLPDRPHRPCVIAYEPSSLDVVSFEMIKDYVKDPQPQPASSQPQPPAAPWNMRAGSKAPTLENYVKTAVDKECIAVSIAPNLTRNDRLNIAAGNLGQLSSWPEMNVDDAKQRLYRAAIQVGLTELETHATIKSGWSWGEKNPRQRPQPQAQAAQQSRASDPSSSLAGKPAIKYASKVKTRRVEFLWPGRIPKGKLTTFAGHGGLGKTFVLCDMAAIISQGGPWPLSGGECAKKGKTLFISGEDDEEDTLVPRLIECGANLDNIAFFTEDFHDAFSLRSLALLEQAVDEMGDVEMVVVDPPTSYLEGVDDHKNADLRSQVLRPLSRFARVKGPGVILNNHVNKSGKDVEAACRVMGSVAWVNGVRTAYLFVRDGGDPDRVTIAPIKTNVGKFPSAISYKIVETKNGLAKVEWLDEANQNADQVMGSKTPGAAAAEWVTDLFRTKRSWLSQDIREMARECGHSESSVFKSREVKALPIRKLQNYTAEGVRYWTWTPRTPLWPESAESAESDLASPLVPKSSSLSGNEASSPKVRPGPKVSGESLSGGEESLSPPWAHVPESEEVLNGNGFTESLSTDSSLSGWGKRVRPEPGPFTDRAFMERLRDEFPGD